MEVSRAAPELALEDLAGNPVSLSALRGQIVLVNNWATWCPPCRAEMPALEAYYREHRGEGFTLVAIDAGDPVSEVERFAQSLDLTFPIWMDRNSAALAAFNTTALPSSFVIDRQGTIRLAWTGAIDRATLERYVTPLIEAGL
jgi:peroxiredoxin